MRKLEVRDSPLVIRNMRFLLHMQEQSSGNLVNTGLELIREFQARNKFGSHGDDI